MIGYASDSLNVSYDLCTGCGVCVEVCPHEVFLLIDRKAIITHQEDCMECGACKKNCSASAISVRSGVGCASAMIQSIFTGKEATCGCSTDSCC